MSKENTKRIARQILQIGLAAVLLSGFASAQASKEPRTAEDFYKRGLAKSESDGCGYGIEDFDKAIELNPRDIRFYKERGECLLYLDRQAALADFNKIIQLQPNYAEAFWGRGQVYFDEFRASEMTSEDAGKALADFNKAIALKPKKPEFYIQRAKLYFHYFKDYKKAFQDFDRAVKTAPRNDEYLLSRATHYRIRGEYDKAIADCTVILKFEPRDFDALVSRGQNYFSLGAFQKAINDFSAAIKAEPEYADQVYEKRAAAYREIGNVRLAEADEKRIQRFKTIGIATNGSSVLDASRSQPLNEQELRDSYIFSTREKIKLISGDDEKSRKAAEAEIERLTKLLAESPLFYARAFVMRAHNQLKLGEYDKAIADYTDALKYAEVDSYNFRGIAYARKDDYALAIADFTKALDKEIADTAKLLEIELKQTTILYNRGLAYFNKGDYALAIADLTALIADNQNDIKLYQLRAKAYRALGKTVEAEADEKKLKALTGND